MGYGAREGLYSRIPKYDSDGNLIFSFKDCIQAIWINMFPLMRANWCFLLFCIPIVTIPAAFTCLYGVCTDIINNRNTKVFKTFIQIFKTEWLHSLAIGIPAMLLLAMGAQSAIFYFGKLGETKFWLLPACLTCALLLLLLMMLPMIHIMLARVDVPAKTAVKNSVFIAILRVRYTLPAAAIGILVTYLQLRYLIFAIPVLFLVGVSIPVMIKSYLDMNAIQQVILPEGW